MATMQIIRRSCSAQHDDHTIQKNSDSTLYDKFLILNLSG